VDVVKIFSTLDRHMVRQVVAPAVLGFVTYTFLLMMRGLFSLVEQIFVRGLPVKDAMAVLGATLPHVMVLTIPMGFLFGVLLGVGRMTTDNEIVALQAGGISARRLLVPIIGLGLMLTLLSGYLFTSVIPRANRSLRDLRIRLFTSAKTVASNRRCSTTSSRTSCCTWSRSTRNQVRGSMCWRMTAVRPERSASFWLAVGVW
jgi:lipopolysaccharide export system permease protein